jgi:selenide, water dikinase
MEWGITCRNYKSIKSSIKILMESVKLTQYSKGAGCGCKIAPGVLEEILKSDFQKSLFPDLLVGNESKDDAAVYKFNNDTGIVSTIDFFTPIVDDPFMFGEIASANALSDVYAMGGKPIMALAVLGWPVEKIPGTLAQQVLNGARSICNQVAIPLAGGHSIDSPEPIFGLAVTGVVSLKHIKKNNTAVAGDLLYLTKPLGVGMITTAHKRGIALDDDFVEAVQVMKKLNAVGELVGSLRYVNALTDVTGFGLLGHLIEVCDGSNLSAEIEYGKIPLLKNIQHYVSKMIYPDNTFRNWNACEKKVEGIGSESLLTLCDPQTSGGLLVSVSSSGALAFEKVMLEQGYDLTPFGKLIDRKPIAVYIR